MGEVTCTLHDDGTITVDAPETLTLGMADVLCQELAAALEIGGAPGYAPTWPY